MHKARGFTLIELSIVLFIASLLITVMVSALSNLTINAKISATHTKEDAIKTALSTFITRNNRLPCPAIPTLTSAAVGYGVEAANIGVCTGVPASGVAPNVVVTGVIPWASLGLPEDASLDAYSNRFTYQVVLQATGLNQATVSGMRGVISTHSAGPGVMQPPAVGNQTNDCSVTAANNPCAGVAIVVSHGQDGYGAYTQNGGQIPFDPSVVGGDERENANGDSKFVIKNFSNVDSNPFDDIVLIMTAGDFLTPLAASGTLKDYQSNLNATFALLKNSIFADAYKNGGMNGGNRFYQFQNTGNWPGGLLASQRTDPWGNSIVYTNNRNTIDCTNNPGDVVFMLSSKGPDGVVSAPDDQTVTVYAAEVMAIIAAAGCNK